MLVFLLYHIFITFFCLWAGYLCSKYILRKKDQTSPIVNIIYGLILLTLLCQVWILFFPLTDIFQLAVVFGLLVIAIFKRDDFIKAFNQFFNEIRSLTLAPKLLLVTGWFMILVMNTGPILMDDTESYHMQMVLWIREYGTVPGLVNLHERFGFNSSWFTSIAFFSFPTDRIDSYQLLNGVISIWMLYYLVTQSSVLFQLKKNQLAFTALMLLTVVIFCWPLIRGNAASSNYDFIAAFILLILFFESFKTDHVSKTEIPLTEWIIWPAYLFTVRITNYPLLLLSVFAILVFLKNKKQIQLLKPAVFALFLGIPFLARNVLISGYPFFPAPFFDFFTADWKADPAMIEELLRYIKYYGRVSTTFMDIDQTELLNFPEWVPVWFKHLFIYDKILVFGGITGLIICLKHAFMRKPDWPKIIMTAVLLTGFTSWFFISPDPRFAYGYILCGICILLLTLLRLLNQDEILKKFFSLSLIVMISLIGIYSMNKVYADPKYRNWLAPAAVPKPPVKEVRGGNITFNIPEPILHNWNARCYTTSLPCLYEIQPGLTLRGETIRSGFRIEK